MSLEKSCEDVELLILGGQSALSGFSRVNYDADSDADKDRIIVKSEPRQPALFAANGVDVRKWMVPVGVTIKLATKSAAQMDTLMTAINDANNVGPAPAVAITAATTAFPNGMRIENLPEGERETEERARQYTARFAFYVAP
jgi:hypothetical protein